MLMLVLGPALSCRRDTASYAGGASRPTAGIAFITVSGSRLARRHMYLPPNYLHAHRADHACICAPVQLARTSSTTVAFPAPIGCFAMHPWLTQSGPVPRATPLPPPATPGGAQRGGDGDIGDAGIRSRTPFEHRHSAATTTRRLFFPTQGRAWMDMGGLCSLGLLVTRQLVWWWPIH